MPPFIHRCLVCKKLTFSYSERTSCKHCKSQRLDTFRVTRHQPEWVSRRELIITLVVLALALIILAFLE